MVFKYNDSECKVNLLFFRCSWGNRIKETTRYNHVWLKEANWGGCVYPPLLSSRLPLSVQIQIDQSLHHTHHLFYCSLAVEFAFGLLHHLKVS